MRRRVVIVLVVALTAGACSGEPDDPLRSASVTTSPPGPSLDTIEPVPSGNATSEPVPTEPAPSDPVPVTPDGFERVRATVTGSDGAVCELCLWLADTADRRSRGLMFATDIGDADGMAFVYPTPHTGHFWMKNTLLPLSIAFFAADGEHLDAFDMEPCAADPCPLYPTPGEFLIAIETNRGGLADLGIGPGSVLELTDLSCADAADRAGAG